MNLKTSVVKATLVRPGDIIFGKKVMACYLWTSPAGIYTDPERISFYFGDGEKDILCLSQSALVLVEHRELEISNEGMKSSE